MYICIYNIQEIPSIMNFTEVDMETNITRQLIHDLEIKMLPPLSHYKLEGVCNWKDMTNCVESILDAANVIYNIFEER